MLYSTLEIVGSPHAWPDGINKLSQLIVGVMIVGQSRVGESAVEVLNELRVVRLSGDGVQQREYKSASQELIHVDC